MKRFGEEMRRDDRVILLGEDIGVPGGFGGAFTVTLGLEQEFGHERVLDTPISEAAIAGVAAGAAMGGLARSPMYSMGTSCSWQWISWRTRRPRCAICPAGRSRYRWCFALRWAPPRAARSMDSRSKHSDARPRPEGRLPVKSVRRQGHAEKAIRDPNPVIFFEHKLLYGSKGARKESGGIELVVNVPEEEYLIPFGQAKVVRSGDDITIVANLLMVHRSAQAAKAGG